MSMSQDWDLDEVIAHSKEVKVDKELAIDKYYEIFRYLRTFDEYKDGDFNCTEAAVTRTKNWLSAYATKNNTVNK